MYVVLWGGSGTSLSALFFRECRSLNTYLLRIVDEIDVDMNLEYAEIRKSHDRI